MSENVIFELSDIEVDTLGLVNQGANREEFFLMKNADGTEVSEPTTATLTEQVTQSVWQRFMGLFQKAAQDVMPESVDEEDTQESTNDELAATAKTEVEPEAVVVEAKTAKVEPEAEPETVATKVSETAKAETVEPVVEVPAPLTKEDITMEANVMAENDISKADYESIAKRLEVAETELAKAREEKAQQVWLTKAAGYGYLPVAQAELAGKLYSIAKLDGALAEWVVDVFKAVDNMVADSGLFVEKGHNIPEVDAVTKAMQAADPKAALLGLPKAEAEAYLAAVRARGRG